MVNRDLSVAPQYCVKDTETCTDEFALAIMEAVNERANAIINSEKIDKFYAEPVRRPIEINRGHCEDVSTYVYDAVVHAGFDEERIQIINRAFMPYGDSQQRHSWIAYHAPDGKAYHFDSELPWGVHPWYYLPTFHRHPNEFNVPEIQMHYTDPRDDPHNDIKGFTGMNIDTDQNSPQWFDEEQPRE